MKTLPRAGVKLPHPISNAQDRVEEHVATEIINDVDTIMPTISTWDVHFAIVSEPSVSGVGLMLATNTQEARTYYEGTRDAWNMIAGYELRQIATPWYVFQEVVGDIELLPQRKRRIGRFAILFPTWLDGIIGEIVWERPGADDRPEAYLEADLPGTQLRNHQLLQTWTRCMAENDRAGLLDCMEERSTVVIRATRPDGSNRSRVVLHSKADFAAQMAAAPVRVTSLKRSNWVVSDWYLFVEYELELEIAGQAIARKSAVIYPVSAAGKISGILGYAFDSPIATP
jgi:hypothetical protein